MSSWRVLEDTGTIDMIHIRNLACWKKEDVTHIFQKGSRRRLYKFHHDQHLFHSFSWVLQRIIVQYHGKPGSCHLGHYANIICTLR